MITVEEWLIIRNLKRNHPEMGTRKIAEFFGRSRGAVRKALSSERYCKHGGEGGVLILSEPAVILPNKETGGVMARRNILMNKIVEGICQWHKGMSIRRASRSSEMDRKTLRKYLTMARRCGVVREHPFEEEEIGRKLGILRQVRYEAPAMNALGDFRADIERWLKEPSITIKKIWQRIAERGVSVGYSSVKRYLTA
jgi:hypothetical protein